MRATKRGLPEDSFDVELRLSKQEAGALAVLAYGAFKKHHSSDCSDQRRVERFLASLYDEMIDAGAAHDPSMFWSESQPLRLEEK